MTTVVTDAVVDLQIERIRIEDAEAVYTALLCYGVRGRYETLAEAVQALGRRAEAAETAAPTDAPLDDVLVMIVRALQHRLAGDRPEDVVLTALAVQRELGRSYRIVSADDRG